MLIDNAVYLLCVFHYLQAVVSVYNFQLELYALLKFRFQYM